jgi:hypothetical protein
MTVARRLQGIGTKGRTPVSSCEIRAKAWIRPAKFADESGQACLTPCLTFTTFNALFSQKH